MGFLAVQSVQNGSSDDTIYLEKIQGNYKMKSKKRSRTAQMAAVIRALHFAYESPVVFEDPFAGQMAGPGWHFLCKSRLLYLFATRTIYKSLDPIRRQVLARARYAEDKLQEALESGIRQYVIIGAGLDSFALRRGDLDGKISIYELDHPATQQAKKARVKALNLCLPEHHEFVPIDFEKENICDALAGSSYDPRKPAFFSWLGTVHYISQPAVFKTLTSIQSCAGLDSELVFDYAISEKHYSHQDHKTVTDLKRYTKRRGEPIVSTFDPDVFPRQVSQLGFVLMENVSPGEQAKRYFNATDRGEKMIMPGSCFIHFRVKENDRSGIV